MPRGSAFPAGSWTSSNKISVGDQVFLELDSTGAVREILFSLTASIDTWVFVQKAVGALPLNADP